MRKWSTANGIQEDNMFELYNSLIEEDPSTVMIPEGYHIFFKIHDENHSNAGVWIWEDGSDNFLHFTGKAPLWWRNLESLTELSIMNIDSNKDKIDLYLRKLISDS